MIVEISPDTRELALRALNEKIWRLATSLEAIEANSTRLEFSDRIVTVMWEELREYREARDEMEKCVE
jgi:hypothetical protein